ncbi:MAG: hypothetical protein KDB20_10170, partial [Microthrixaceae bacterium]|nr:hypothetical protein [Microthrixaceae bacterium]
PAARSSERAPAMLRPWVTVRERSSGMFVVLRVGRPAEADTESVGLRAARSDGGDVRPAAALNQAYNPASTR